MKPYFPPGTPGGETDLQGRILLVEDDPDTAEFYRHVLTKRGRFDVTHTTDPVIALVLAISEVWDLVLASADLPAMSGYEVFGALRTLAPHLPVILMAHPLDSCPPALGILQPEAVLAKPVRADHLLAATSAAISRPRPGANGPSAPSGRQE
jgi:DNA-binding response OmpR family regulator